MQQCGAELLDGLFAERRATKLPTATLKPKERARKAKAKGARATSAPKSPILKPPQPKNVTKIQPFSNGLRSFLFGKGGCWHLQKDGRYWLVEVDCHVPPQDLTGQLLDGIVSARHERPTSFEPRPRPGRALDEVIEASRTTPLTEPRPVVGPRAEGLTTIERIPNLGDQARQVERLVQRDDPYAWCDILSSWRVVLLRPVLKPAMARIGWEKLKLLIDRHHGWPAGVRQLVLGEYQKMKNRPPVPKPVRDFFKEYDLADY